MEENKDFHNNFVLYLLNRYPSFVLDNFFNVNSLLKFSLSLSKVKKIGENVNNIAFISRSKIVNSYISFDILSISENVHFTY